MSEVSSRKIFATAGILTLLLVGGFYIWAFVCGDEISCPAFITVNAAGPGALATYIGADAPATINAGWNYTMGYRFTPDSDGFIDGLGGYFEGTKKVTLWDNGGIVLATANVTPAPANNWTILDIIPVPVSAGQTYWVGVYVASSGGARFVKASPASSAGITMTGGYYRSGDVVLPTSSPTFSPTNWYGTADVSFTVNAAPEWGVDRDTDTDPNELQDWAWGDRVVGWISFNCADEDMVCPASNFAVVMEPLTSPPSALNLTTNFTSAPGPSCGSARRLDWDFFDSEDDITQTAYQVQVALDAGFTSPVQFDSGKVTNPATERSPEISSTPVHEFDDGEADGDGQLAFDTDYYWRVQVWDSDDNTSDWVAHGSPTSFRTSLHAYPQFPSPAVPRPPGRFDWAPASPSEEETVIFTDLTTFFTAPGNQAWNWDIPTVPPPGAQFVDGTIESDQNPHVQFPQGPNVVTLTAIDLELAADSNSGNGECDATDTIDAAFPLPEFREIPPVSFWGHMLAFLSSIRNIFT